MSRPDDIPQDVWGDARKVWLEIRRPELTGALPSEAIARAILDERERCAKVAESQANTSEAYQKICSEEWPTVQADNFRRLAAAIRTGATHG